MQISYDPEVDALYIQLTEKAVFKTQQMSAHCFIDVDAEGGVIGIEVLHARQSGIDPLVAEIIAPGEAERPDSDTLREGRAARMQAVKNQRER